MITYDRKGFTLIEILIVVAIIAILASIVLVGLGPTQQSGRDARRLSDLHEVQNGLELYYNSCGYYPGTDVSTPCAGIANSGGYVAMKATIVNFGALGINSMPDDPTAGQHYTYSTLTDDSSYILSAKLENVGNSVFNSYTPPANTGNYTWGNGVPPGGTGGACTTPYYCVSL